MTSAQSLLAAILLVDLRFSRRKAIGLAVLFVGQLVFPSTAIRWGFTAFYLAASVGLLVFRGAERRRLFFGLLRECLDEGIVSEAMLKAEMEQDHVRHDAFEMLEQTPALAA